MFFCIQGTLATTPLMLASRRPATARRCMKGYLATDVIFPGLIISS